MIKWLTLNANKESYLIDVDLLHTKYVLLIYYIQPSAHKIYKLRLMKCNSKGLTNHLETEDNEQCLPSLLSSCQLIHQKYKTSQWTVVQVQP